MNNSKENKINPKILKLCREQMGLSVEKAQKKAGLKTLSDIESGKRQPTFKQIDKLSKIYLVPSWVFLRNNLPNEYNFNKIPSFRTFNRTRANNFNYELRFILAKIESSRELILDLKKDLGESIKSFSAPDIKLSNMKESAKQIRKWLNVDEESLNFDEWRQRLEDVGIFVFLTNKFAHWSKTDIKYFRGLSVFHDKLPVIVINGSDNYKAQSFTLFHELCHVIRGKTKWDTQIGIKSSAKEEQLCDNFAGEILMPKEQALRYRVSSFDQVKKFSKEFKTSQYASIVRLRQLNIINQAQYKDFVTQLDRKNAKEKQKLKESEGGPNRKIYKEAIDRYGGIYTKTILQAYYNKDLTLYKTRNMFDFKKTKYVLKLKEMVS